jgi:uncharacterized protein YodC (DUF2158 family)
MARSSTFKIGDLVQLKSGGPVMTVEKVFSEGGVRCTWFSGAKHNTNVFDVETLVAAPSPSKAAKGE